MRESKEPILSLIDIRDIELDPDNVRSAYDEQTIAQLKDALRTAQGAGEQYIHPPTVYPLGGGRYRVKHGNCRVLAASGIADELWVRIVDPPSSRGEKILDQLSENLVHGELNPIDTALALRKLRQTEELSLGGLVDVLVERGITRGRFWVKLHLDLLQLHPTIQAFVRSGRLSSRSAWLLRNLPEAEQVILGNEIVEQGWSRQQLTERLGLPAGNAEGDDDPASPEAIHTTMREQFESLVRTATEDRTSSDRPSRSTTRQPAVLTRWELVPASLSTSASDEKLTPLFSHAWAKQASELQRQLAGEAVLFGNRAPEEAIALVQRIEDELNQVPQSVIVALNVLRDLAENPSELARAKGLLELLKIRSSRLAQS